MAPSAATAATPREPRLPADDVARFRRSIARFATGIAVVGCLDDEDRPQGITVNSFTSISLEPPTVLVSLRPGRAHTLLRRRGVYGVSVLADGHEAWSHHFGGRPQAELAAQQPSPWELRGGVPVLRGALAWFSCEVASVVQIHDHTLFVARVADCDHGDGRPLMFYASRYHRPVCDA
jgi:styrene monooxygenase reductase component